MPVPRSKAWGKPRHLQLREGYRSDAPSYVRSEPATIFTKTKMCRFHILGMCSRGAQCRFAHHRSELKALPDLSRTKLCRALIYEGACEDPCCRYAHAAEELRSVQAARSAHRGWGRPGAGAWRAARPRPGPAAAAQQQRQQAAALQQLLSGVSGPSYWLETSPEEASSPPADPLPQGEEEEGEEVEELGEIRKQQSLPAPSAHWESALEAVHGYSSDLIVKNTFIHLCPESHTRRTTRSSTWAGWMHVPAPDSVWRSGEASGLYSMDPMLVPLPSGSSLYCEAAPLLGGGDPLSLTRPSSQLSGWREEAAGMEGAPAAGGTAAPPPEPPGHGAGGEGGLPTLLTSGLISQRVTFSDGIPGESRGGRRPEKAALPAASNTPKPAPRRRKAGNRP